MIKVFSVNHVLHIVVGNLMFVPRTIVVTRIKSVTLKYMRNRSRGIRWLELTIKYRNGREFFRDRGVWVHYQLG